MSEEMTLLELNQTIRNTLDSSLEPSYWVVAEVGELRVNQKGHCYLDLIEKQNEKVVARLRATIWSYTWRNLSTWFEGMTGQPLKAGIKILCNLKVQYHELYGLSANIRDIDAQYTLGERAKRRQEVINQLKEEGVFDMNKSHHLPIVPQRIAIISSPSAAGYGDFMDQISSNAHGYAVATTFYKASMQGEEAVTSIVGALHQIAESAEEFDLAVIIRGGGAQIDLDCFDQYDLAAHVAQFPLPVITGIGHDRDETVTDLVAHTALKTPTAAAEFILQGFEQYEVKVIEIMQRMSKTTRNLLQMEQLKLQHAVSQLKNIKGNRLFQEKERLTRHLKDLRRAGKHALDKSGDQLNRWEKEIKLMDPERILQRGYTFSAVNGKPVSGQKIKKGDVMTTYTASQKIESNITDINEK